MGKYLTKSLFKVFLLYLIDALFKPIFSIFVNKKIPKSIKKILIVKPDHLGDMILTTSIFKHLKDKYNEALIDIVCGEWALPIIENNPYIRHKFVINVAFANRKNLSKIKKILESIKTYFSSLVKIRKEKYDVALFLRSRRGNLISLALLGNIKYTIGHGTAGFGFLLSNEVKWEKGKHELEHYLELLKPIGIEKAIIDLKPQLFTKEEDIAKAKEFYNSLNTTSKIAILHPGSGNMVKTISIDRWQKVLEILISNGYYVVITGSKSEENFAKRIATKEENLTIATGVFDIKSLFEFFKLADLIITVDSLSAHLAAMTEVKTLVFYSGVSDINQWRPVGKNIKVLKIDCPDSPCEMRCRYNYACMKFDVEEILKQEL
jgi:ADP-heptose:LPS heptosyltransferase